MIGIINNKDTSFDLCGPLTPLFTVNDAEGRFTLTLSKAKGEADAQRDCWYLQIQRGRLFTKR